MASKLKLKNINGKEISIVNPDTYQKDKQVDVSSIVEYVSDRDALKAKVGVLGDVVLQKDIALAYEWVEPQQTDNGGTIINPTNNTTGSWVSLVQTVMITNLPTSDPLVSGQLWNNAGIVTVSAG